MSLNFEFGNCARTGGPTDKQEGPDCTVSQQVSVWISEGISEVNYQLCLEAQMKSKLVKP